MSSRRTSAVNRGSSAGGGGGGGGLLAWVWSSGIASSLLGGVPAVVAFLSTGCGSFLRVRWRQCRRAISTRLVGHRRFCYFPFCLRSSSCCSSSRRSSTLSFGSAVTGGDAGGGLFASPVPCLPLSSVTLGSPTRALGLTVALVIAGEADGSKLDDRFGVYRRGRGSRRLRSRLRGGRRGRLRLVLALIVTRHSSSPGCPAGTGQVDGRRCTGPAGERLTLWDPRPAGTVAGSASVGAAGPLLCLVRALSALFWSKCRITHDSSLAKIGCGRQSQQDRNRLGCASRRRC